MWSFRCLANFDAEALFQKGHLCSLYLEVKSLPVWPTYTFPQSGHVSLLAPEHVNLS